MADYVFEGKSIHVDAHIADGTIFDETFTYTDSADNPIDLTGFTAFVEVRNVDTKEVIYSGDENSAAVNLGGSAGTVQVVFDAAAVALMINPCYEWDVKLNDTFRFVRGYIYRNQLL